MSTDLHRRAFTGAWIETHMLRRKRLRHQCRAFTGAWIETFCCGLNIAVVNVAPSQARGLKLPVGDSALRVSCRAFTGAWIETPTTVVSLTADLVAPSQARGLKRHTACR